MWPFGEAYPERAPRDVADKEYDYIVVGGGTSGCVIASRLSEDPRVSVLLLCRGTVADSFLTRIPLASASNGESLQPQVVASEPVPGYEWDQLRAPTSQALGGATRINGLMMTRGAPGCWEQWREMGNDRWGWDSVEPYFCKFENALCHPDAKHRGHDGPLQLRHMPSFFPIENKYMPKAAATLGFPVKKDLNDPSNPACGVFDIDTMIDQKGFRCSAFHGYLPKTVALERRGHLTICTGALASRLSVADDGDVEGVHFIDHLNKRTPKEFFVRAKREVIVCCGAMFSPQLLLLSGIGPKADLDSHKIPIVRDLPGVGDNLEDHLSWSIQYEVAAADSLLRLLNPLFALYHFLLFLLFRSGLLAGMWVKKCIWVRSGAIDEATMTLRAVGDDEHGPDHDNLDPLRPENVPDLELLFVPAPGDVDSQKMRHPHFNTLLVVLVQCHSRGRVELASPDPLAGPRMHHPWARDPRDLAIARTGTRLAMHCIERLRGTGCPAPAAWRRCPGVADGVTEGSWRDADDAAVDAWVRSNSRSTFHYTSTCRMAPEAEGGVVGQDLRVHGFRNLRVADASVFPKITSAHTMAPTLMVAERCADFVKADWKMKV